MATGLASWSKTAASNASADSAVNWAEGQSPSSVNDSARGMMASLAKWRDDNTGSLSTGGSSTAYTVSTNQGFASLAAMDLARISLTFHTASGSNPTLNVDSLGAKNIVFISGAQVKAGDLTTGVYDLVYNNSLSSWIIISNANQLIPSGTVMIFAQTSAPTGWTKVTGSGDDSALRLTTGTASTGGSTAFTSVMASRSITVAQSNLPNVNLSASSLTATFTGTAGQVVGSGTGTAGNTGTTFTAVSGNNGVPAGTISIGGNVPLGGSGTAISVDFAVKYVDVIRATKN